MSYLTCLRTVIRILTSTRQTPSAGRSFLKGWPVCAQAEKRETRAVHLVTIMAVRIEATVQRLVVWVGEMTVYKKTI